METEDRPEVQYLLDTAQIGLYVLGIRALVDPDKYPQTDFTNRAMELVKTRFATDGGYEIPGELLSLAFPSDYDLSKM